MIEPFPGLNSLYSSEHEVQGNPPLLVRDAFCAHDVPDPALGRCDPCLRMSLWGVISRLFGYYLEVDRGNVWRRLIASLPAESIIYIYRAIKVT